MRKIILAMALIAMPHSTSAAQETGCNGGVDTVCTMTGKLSTDGGTFTAKDGKEWVIKNPSAVRGHEGQKVMLTGKIPKTEGPGQNGGIGDESRKEIHVMSVKPAGTEGTT